MNGLAYMKTVFTVCVWLWNLNFDPRIPNGMKSVILTSNQKLKTQHFINLRKQKQFGMVELMSAFRASVNTYHTGIGFTAHIFSCFLTFLKFWWLFHELMNQYQACLNSFECIFHKDSKYSNQIPECWHFLPNLLHFSFVVCSRPPHWKC